MKPLSLFLCALLIPAAICAAPRQTVTTGTLLDEMTDLQRLASMPSAPYKNIQFSSYDRQSRSVSEPGWFANSDGFGGETIPAFEQVIAAPDGQGIGTYLICDVKGPGAVLRLWTATIDGDIRMFLDGSRTPVFEGRAIDFFWNFAAAMDGSLDPEQLKGTIRQFDATYFPIPFAKQCRIEWTGDIRKAHFYHVGVRLYTANVSVETFKPSDIKKYRTDLDRAIDRLKDRQTASGPATGGQAINTTVTPHNRTVVTTLAGSRAVTSLQLRVDAPDTDRALRQSILRIYFDGASVPQVESPVGDFFGAAPGVNPYQSLPMSVWPDGTMESRWVMPFRDSARIEILNFSDETVKITGAVKTEPHPWDGARSMHFRARWRADYDLQGSNTEISDIPYLLAMGQGRVVGAACYLLNPTHVPSSWGNWWGEGDEKIFVDDTKSPAFYGTGSEDYFNYSWSAEEIFEYPYCGQPRNDGPANRGFVANFRWHITDDLPFYDQLAFYMELWTHGDVPGFAYARMVYAYGRPGMLDDHKTIIPDDVRPLSLPAWDPVGYRPHSAPCRFVPAEDAVSKRNNPPLRYEYGNLWAGGRLLVWSPVASGDSLTFNISSAAAKKADMYLTVAHTPSGGRFRLYINGAEVKIVNRPEEPSTVSLRDDHRTLSRTLQTEPVEFRQGNNELTLKSADASGTEIGIDFFWVK